MSISRDAGAVRGTDVVSRKSGVLEAMVSRVVCGVSTVVSLMGEGIVWAG